MVKISSSRFPTINLKVIPGHFVTPNSHISHYMDLATLKSRQSEAAAVASAMAEAYSSTTIIDTIVCMDGCDVIGAYLADELTKGGILSQNAHKTMYIVAPERTANGQIIFRDNNTMMIKGKNVLLLLANSSTGQTVMTATNAIKYYGGNVVGISAIFSAITKIAGMPIHAVFTTADLGDYHSYASDNCDLCKAGVPVDAFANGYGYSQVWCNLTIQGLL